jgi:hypothetical protein
LELSKQDLQNEIDTLKRQWEALGLRLIDLPAHQGASVPPKKPGPTTDEEKDFRRDVANQLVASWRAAWDAKKDEPRDYIESAMWNISGLRLFGEVGARIPFDGRYHECNTPVSSGQSVQVLRPGWVLDESERDYVVLKTLVATT